MHASQRGSVLLTVIAGILILAVVGTAALSLMTGSVMTVVDGRETVQAAYLAESGKEIVRAQTESKSGEALMDAAISLSEPQEDDGKKFVVDGAGFVKTRLYPSWYRLQGDTWETTSFGWYGGTPMGNREWLVIPPNEAFDEPFRYKGQVGEHLKTEAADVYLIGRVDGTPVYDASASRRDIRVKAKKVKEDDKDDFYYFPESGGLIGLVAQGKAEEDDEGKPQTTTVSDIRFFYDTLKKPEEGSQEYVFSNVTPFPQNIGPETITAALKGHDVALGQYFRVECESVTNYGARSALVWHTNGRNSLRYADNGSGNGGEDGVVGGNKVKELVNIFDGNMKDGKVTGDNIIGNLKKDDDELVWDFNATGKDNIHGSNTDIEINHFLKQGDGGNNQEYWWVAVARQWLAYHSGKSVPLESMMQYSFEPDYDEDKKGKKDNDEENTNYFTGILCRLAFVDSFSPPKVSSVGTVQQGKGARGIGVGVLQGEITFHKNEDKVKAASVNPALLPGFRYKKSGNEDENKDKGAFTISPEERAMWYGHDGLLGRPYGKKFPTDEDDGPHIVLYPVLVVWAYDDLAVNTDSYIQSLRPLAIAGLTQKNYLDVDDYLSLTVKVREEGGENHLTVWLQEKEDDLIEGDTPPQFPGPGKNLVNKWIYMAQDVSYETDTSLSTTLAVGEAFRRVGIFSEAYAFKNMNDNHANIEIGNFFFTGTGSGGGSLFPGGLTPGIVN